MLIASVLKPLNNHIRKSSFITSLLFGVKVHKQHRIHWDFTTLALKRCLPQVVKPHDKILEIGTGPYALLSVFLKKSIDCEVWACDINTDYIEEAAKTAKANSTELKVTQSNLFSNINQKFNVIFFNIVYIPRAVGKKLGIFKLHKYETDWCGGEDGLETIVRFLQDAVLYLRTEGVILMGFNTKYLDQKQVIQLSKTYGYSVAVMSGQLFNPSVVLKLKKGNRYE